MGVRTHQNFQGEQTLTETVIFTDTQIPSSTTATHTPIFSETPIFSPAPEDQTPTLLNSPLPTNTITPIPLVYPALRGSFESDEVLVKLRSSTSIEKLNNCLGGLGFQIEMEIDELNVLVLQIQDGQVARSLALLNSCAGVKYAEPNYLASIADTIPNDPGFGSQYGLISIRAPQGWDLSTGSSAVIIAIIDSGVDLSHPDLASKITAGYDFVNNDTIPQDDFGHGTHVAGIAAATGNNGTGVTGVSWGARIMPIKVLNAAGNGTFANVAAGIIWAVDNGAQVINLSLGGNTSSLVLQDAVNYAYSNGVVLVAASGNTGSGVILYPAAYPHVIAVGAVDNTNNHAGFSNFGPEMDLMAPGVSIYSTIPGGYGLNSGTSMAAPYVSGLAAILRGYPGGFSPDAIEFEMESTALDLGIAGRDNLYGYGLIQLDYAIQLVYFPPTSTLSPTSTSVADVLGNQLPPVFNNGPALAWTSTPTLTQTPSLSLTSTGISPSTLTYTTMTQVEDGSEVYALDTPKATPGSVFSYYYTPCLGILFILLGLWLFYITGRKRVRSRANKRTIKM